MIKVVDLIDYVEGIKFEFKNEKEFKKWAREYAYSVDDDLEFLRSFNFDDVEQCKEYIELMGYAVQ